MNDDSEFERTHSFVRGSDVPRDGMFLEVAKQGHEEKPLFEIFYCDQTGRMTINLWCDSVSLDLMEYAIDQARKRLPPVVEG